MAPVFGYWKIRGLAQPIRLLLAYTGTEYENKLYEAGPPPTYDRSEWLSVKFNLGLDFPNLPYYIDDDVKLTQSTAIIRYIARKHNLMGTTDQEKARVDMVECQLEDFRKGFTSLCYSPDHDKLKPAYLNDLPGKLKLFSDFLGSNPYFAGSSLSYADFLVYEMLDQHKLFSPGCLDQYPNLKQFTERIEALPAIAAYMRSDKFLKKPLNGRMAKFGGDD
jgi:glutathione S-transferase